MVANDTYITISLNLSWQHIIRRFGIPLFRCEMQRDFFGNRTIMCGHSSDLESISLRLMTSQFEDIVNHTQKLVSSMHILWGMGSKCCVKIHTKF